MSDKGLKLLGDGPAYYQYDPRSLAVLDALGREIQRVEDMVVEVIDRFCYPHLAQDDQYGSLPYWERLLELPIAPVGVAEAERQTRVVATFRSRRAARGTDWISLMNTIVGSTLWDHEEGPAAYTVVITLPDDFSDTAIAGVNALARKITPAHLALSYATSDRFIVGLSALGVAEL